MEIPEIEQWIKMNESIGSRRVFKMLCVEKDGINLYTRSVAGVRYGNFAITKHKEGFVVTHLKTGGRCTTPFPSEKTARRFIFCINGLHDWKEVKWAKEPPHINKKLTHLCYQAFKYIVDGSGYCEELLDAVISFLPEDESEIEIPDEVVSFGSIGSKPTKTKTRGRRGFG